MLLHDRQATLGPKPPLEPAMRCEVLAKSFGALKAVDEVSFQVPRGAVLGIGGPNGAGKTTFFDLISGVQSPTSGRIWINEQEMTNERADSFCRAGVARTFQQDVAFDSMTAVENVRVAAYFGRDNRHVPSLIYDTRSYQQAMDALNSVGLAGKAYEFMGNMPVLDRKLVMLAGAIVTDPILLLMDEPVGGLIPAEIEIFEKILGAVLEKGRTLVIIEHVMSFLLKVSDRMLIMHEGQVIFDGPKGAMLNDENVVSIYLGKTAAGMLRKEFGVGGSK